MAYLSEEMIYTSKKHATSICQQGNYNLSLVKKWNVTMNVIQQNGLS